MNDQQLHGKQIVMLMLAMTLAIGSYWIPLPQEAGHPAPGSGLSEPTGRSTPMESTNFVREPATMSRFPVMVRNRQTSVVSDPVTQEEGGKNDRRLAQPWYMKLNSHDLANGDKIGFGNAMLVPIKDSDPKSGR